MAPRIALLLCVCFIAWLFSVDMKCRRGDSAGLWIPAIWLAIIGSRPVSYWFNIVGLGSGGGGSDLEGSPVNLLFLLVLIFGGVLVLMRRRLAWSTAIQNNRALFLLYGFFAVSALWSDFPVACLKRIFKDFGCVVAVLVLLTERDPEATIRIACVRVAYVLFPLSVVLNKYFGEIGRNYSMSGGQMFTGVAGHKNSLGQMVFVLGLVVLWDIIEKRRQGFAPGRRMHMGILWGLFGLGVYLLIVCQSSTSLVCFLLGVALFLASGRLVRMRNPKQVLTCVFVVSLFFVAMESTFHIFPTMIEALGRDTTLTGRTNIWNVLKEQPINPLTGYGFLTFWDSELGQAVIEELITLKTAHNGYIDVYLSGGAIGVTLLLAMLLAAGKRTIKDMLEEKTLFRRLGVVVLLLSAIYNVAESSYFMLGPLWFMVILVMMRYPRPIESPSDSTTGETDPSDGNGQTGEGYGTGTAQNLLPQG